ncbi:MAG: hypothetical protein NZM37_05905 [Sandaracinaceae bacterium]|nr:hypothetical protein [Sandaracinaceae bacterium]MDW8245797.1 hypothetical protein [Sandaracinaceae bacterium]
MRMGWAWIGLLLWCGCEDPIVVGVPPPRASEQPKSPPASQLGSGQGEASSGQPQAPAEEGMAGEKALVCQDTDFVESETNRDPFRSFAHLFVPKAPVFQSRLQRKVIMENTSVDEMRLVAIISGIPNPTAMLVDRQGVGHPVRRGDYIGRPEYVSTGGNEGVPIMLNWRVERISPSEIVISREDPEGKGRFSLTRVIPLHEPEERID